MPDKLILLMYESWANLDYAIDGLSLKDATTRPNGGSSIAWTLAG